MFFQANINQQTFLGKVYEEVFHFPKVKVFARVTSALKIFATTYTGKHIAVKKSFC